MHIDEWGPQAAGPARSCHGPEGGKFPHRVVFLLHSKFRLLRGVYEFFTVPYGYTTFEKSSLAPRMILTHHWKTARLRID
jgi:hypothetical protein